MKYPITPDAEVTYFESGQHCVDAVHGDLILVIHDGKMPMLIHAGQRVRYWARRTFQRDPRYDAAYCVWNHAMIVVEGGARARVSQMEAKGGVVVDLLDYVDRMYAVVHPINATEEQRSAAAKFAWWCEGIEYGWFSIFGMVVNVLVPIVEIALSAGQRMVCSTAASLAHRCVGLIPDHADTGVFPADIARYYDVK